MIVTARQQVPPPIPDTGRVQLALNVDSLDEAVAFYTAARYRAGQASAGLRDAVASSPLKLVLLENPGKGGTLNHLGVEVADTATVHAEIARLCGEGLFTDEEMGTTCCFATQDKMWVIGPGGECWEVYTVLADSQTFGAGPQSLVEAGQAPDGGCCGTSASSGIGGACC